MNINEEIKYLEKEEEILTIYLLNKVKTKDFHAVADAAMDLREVITSLNLLNRIKNEGVENNEQ